MANDLAPPRLSPLANSDHRSIRWRRPAGHAHHPKLLETTVHRLLAASDHVLSHRTAIDSNPLWNALSDTLAVFDINASPDPDKPVHKRRHRKHRDGREEAHATPVAVPRPRKRALRRDGGQNLITVLCVLLWNADFSKHNSKGYIGRPEGGEWQPHTWQSLFEFGFGKTIPGELSLARMERWTRVLAQAGFLQTYRRWNEYGQGEYEELPAIKILTTKIFKLCGTFGIYKQLRKDLAKEAESNLARQRLENMGQLVEMDKHKKRKLKEQPVAAQGNAIQRQQDTIADTGPPPRPPGMPEGLNAAGMIEWLRKNKFRA